MRKQSSLEAFEDEQSRMHEDSMLPSCCLLRSDSVLTRQLLKGMARLVFSQLESQQAELCRAVPNVLRDRSSRGSALPDDDCGVTDWAKWRST